MIKIYDGKISLDDRCYDHDTVYPTCMEFDDWRYFSVHHLETDGSILFDGRCCVRDTVYPTGMEFDYHPFLGLEMDESISYNANHLPFSYILSPIRRVFVDYNHDRLSLDVDQVVMDDSFVLKEKSLSESMFSKKFPIYLLILSLPLYQKLGDRVKI